MMPIKGGKRKKWQPSPDPDSEPDSEPDTDADAEPDEDANATPYGRVKRQIEVRKTFVES